MFILPRRRRYLRGRIYLADDKIFSYDNYSKPPRRLLALNNDKNNLHVVKIKSLYDDKGNLRKNLIPIEKNSITKNPSGVHTYVYRKTKWNTPIKESKLVKTNVRLNKWDMAKLNHLK